MACAGSSARTFSAFSRNCFRGLESQGNGEEEQEDETSFIESYGLALGIVIALVMFFVLKGRKGGTAPTSTERVSVGEPVVPDGGPSFVEVFDGPVRAPWMCQDARLILYWQIIPFSEASCQI